MSSLDCHSNYSPRSYRGGFSSEAGCTDTKPWPFVSKNTYIFCAAPQERFYNLKSVYENTAAAASMLADEWKTTDEGRPNVSYTLQICNSCSFSAAASEVIRAKCSQQLTYGNGKHMSNQKPEVKGWPIGYECYLRWLSKPRKWMSFMLTLGWMRWGIWGSASLLKGNSKYNQYKCY